MTIASRLEVIKDLKNNYLHSYKNSKGKTVILIYGSSKRIKTKLTKVLKKGTNEEITKFLNENGLVRTTVRESKKYKDIVIEDKGADENDK